MGKATNKAIALAVGRGHGAFGDVAAIGAFRPG
jgi:hypothetical protein